MMPVIVASNHRTSGTKNMADFPRNRRLGYAFLALFLIVGIWAYSSLWSTTLVLETDVKLRKSSNHSHPIGSISSNSTNVTTTSSPTSASTTSITPTPTPTMLAPNASTTAPSTSSPTFAPTTSAPNASTTAPSTLSPTFAPTTSAVEASTNNNTKTADESARIEIEIPTNNASHFVASDVARVLHVPGESRIEVHLYDDAVRSCRNPFVLGRISGWSLSSFVFGFDDHDHNRSVLVGTYDRSAMPVAGTYYLEVIVLLCERYDDDKDFAHGVDLRQTCLYDHGTGTEHNHQITRSRSSIDVVPVVDEDAEDSSPSPPNNNTSPRMGRWIYKKLLETLAPNNSGAVGPGPTTAALDLDLPPPLYTRYQVRKYSNYPKEWTFLYDNYTYQWNEPGPYSALNRPGLHHPSNEADMGRTPLKVCFLGASHSRVLNKYSQALLVTSTVVEDLNSTRIARSYPNNVTDLNNTEVRSLLGDENCTHVVVGLYQWYFSFKSAKKLFWGDFEEALTAVVRVLDELARDPAFPLRRVILRSLHANGMGYRQSACPPSDWRTFPNSEVASLMVKKIAEGFSSEAKKNNDQEVVSFLDTRFLMDPVWDSSMDWSHYEWEASEIEAKFILSEIMNEEWGRTTTSRG